jgi:hypothetical protein
VIPIAPLLDGEEVDGWFPVCARLEDPANSAAGRLRLKLRMTGLDPSSEPFKAVAAAGGGAFATDSLTLMSRLGFEMPKGVTVVTPHAPEVQLAALHGGLGIGGGIGLGGSRRRTSIRSSVISIAPGPGLGAGGALPGLANLSPRLSRDSSRPRIHLPTHDGGGGEMLPPHSPRAHHSEPIARASVPIEAVRDADARNRIIAERRGARTGNSFFASDRDSHKQLKSAPKGRLCAKLRINVLEATGLAAMDRGGTSDPYVVITLGDSRFRTSVLPETIHPVWGEPEVGEAVEFELERLDETTVLHAVVFDWNQFVDHRFMGELIERVATLEPNVVHDFAYPLAPGDAGEVASGTLRLQLELMAKASPFAREDETAVNATWR